jgi:cytochrome c biogenesis protein CcmG/thiol:disulfide interchange protein DsbE
VTATDTTTETVEETEAPRRRRTVLWASIAVGVIVAIVAIAVGTRPAAGTHQTASPLIGHPVPLAPGQLVTGAPFSPDSLHGQWALVNFFATWCIPCQHEHSELVAFSRRHAGDTQVVSVVFQDDTSHVTSFFAQHGGDWPVVRDPAGRTALDFGVTGVPESYLVDPNGIVVARLVGGVQADALDVLLQQAKARA